MVRLSALHMKSVMILYLFVCDGKITQRDIHFLHKRQHDQEPKKLKGGGEEKEKVEDKDEEERG